MAEWLKAHDSKSCGQQCLGGSNPLASAITKRSPLGLVFVMLGGIQPTLGGTKIVGDE